MAKAKQGFRVGLKERKVELIAPQDGHDHKLTHILRYPTSSEWIDYDRQTSNVKLRGRKTKYESRILEARIHLYDKLVISVEGYVVDGKPPVPLTPEVKAWKDEIPVMHKSEVIGSFGEVCPVEDEDEEEEKNESSG